MYTCIFVYKPQHESDDPTMNNTLLQPLSVKRAPRYREAAYAAIKEAILAGAFVPNIALIEEQIAARLNISRTPVREALAILEHEGLLTARGTRGLFVSVLSREEFVALFIANEAVEPFLVRHAALGATLEQLAALKECLARANQAAEQHDTAQFLHASRDFHHLIGEASGNQPLTTFVLRNEERTDMYLVSSGAHIDQANMRASNAEHGAILRAIADHNPEAGARLAVYHAQSLRLRFADLFTDGAMPE
jgi:DNA-binding GntR family transcriptional regulator